MSFSITAGPNNVVTNNEFSLKLTKYAGHFIVDSYKTDNGCFVTIECNNNGDSKADFVVSGVATDDGCTPNYFVTQANSAYNCRVKKPTYKQLEEQLNYSTAQAAALNQLIVAMQERAGLYLQPNGESDTNFISFVIGILDSPPQRVAQSESATACLNNIKADAIDEANNETLFNLAKLHGSEECARLIKEHLERLADTVRAI